LSELPLGKQRVEGWQQEYSEWAVREAIYTKACFQVQDTGLRLRFTEIGKQTMRRVDHEEGKIDGVGDRSLFDNHEVFHTSKLLGVAEVELDLEAQATGVNQRAMSEFEVSAEKHSVCTNATLQIGLDQDHDVDGIGKVLKQHLRLVDICLNFFVLRGLYPITLRNCPIVELVAVATPWTRLLLLILILEVERRITAQLRDEMQSQALLHHLADVVVAEATIQHPIAQREEPTNPSEQLLDQPCYHAQFAAPLNLMLVFVFAAVRTSPLPLTCPAALLAPTFLLGCTRLACRLFLTGALLRHSLLDYYQVVCLDRLHCLLHQQWGGDTITHADQCQGEATDSCNRLIGVRQEKALQAKSLFSGFTDSAFVTNGQIHLTRSIQVGAKEKPTHLRLRQHRVEPVLQCPVAATFSRPTRNALHGHTPCHCQHRTDDFLYLTRRGLIQALVQAGKQCNNVEHGRFFTTAHSVSLFGEGIVG